MSAAPIALLACLQLAGGPDERQIHWQRSLEDALAISASEGRPILVAVNMDGESACERIVREEYKDPGFVALTRRFACLVSSIFRHTPRDHDDQGRRIACPRLGEVTCGEHVALEPILYERFLGGERIAPRHALILPDGTKVFDLSLLFDLGVIRERLEQGQELAPAPLPADAELDVDPNTHRERLLWEQAVAGEIQPKGLALDGPDPLWSDYLRRLLFVHNAPAHWAEDAVALGLADAAARVLADRLVAHGDGVGPPELGDRAGLLAALGVLDASPARRTLLLSYFVLPNDEAERESAALGLKASLGEGAGALLEALRAQDIPPPAAFEKRGAGAPPAQEPLPEETALTAELEQLERALAAAPDDPALALRMGRAALALARRRMESGGQGVQYLLEDAERLLAQASDARPGDRELLLDRARTAYYLSKFEEEERLALEALGGAAALDLGRPSVPADRLGIEALRWLGDAAGRLLQQRSGGDPPEEARAIGRGGMALLRVALSQEAGADDWVTLASFFAALGRWREEAYFALEGLRRFPDDAGLHQALSRSLHAAGRPDLAAKSAGELALEHPGSATCRWFFGLQSFLLADWLRRGEAPQAAIEEYRRSAAEFAASKELEPGYADSADHYVALAALGRGFAHLLADRQAEAAAALVEGIGLRPAVAGVRDGLDREALDLVDGALEWRRGRPSPVDALGLVDELDAVDPGNATWSRAAADSMLREALRAEGRGDFSAFQRYLAASIEGGWRALGMDDADPVHRRVLAQPLTILGRYLLDQGDADGARRLLEHAGFLMQIDLPEEPEGPEELERLSAELRAALGERRPLDRPGR